MPRLLITGGAGFVGSHCLKRLQAQGHDCVVFDNLSTGRREFARNAPLIVGDLRSESDLERLFASGRFDAVLHFAGLSSVAESVAFPAMYFDTNVRGTELLLRAMERAKIRTLVFSSSCAVYGAPADQPIAETAALAPINPYGETKLVCERMIEKWAVEQEGRSVRLRYFNAAGADPELDIGEDHERESRLIPLALDALTGRRPPLQLYVNGYPTPDGTAVRDFVHICDLADAHAAALDYLLDGGASTALNLGTTTGYSVREVLTEIENVAGCPVPVRISEPRQGDPPMLVGDSASAKSILGWQPQRSTLPVMIGDAWRWHQNRFAPPSTAAGPSLHRREGGSRL